MSTEATGDGKPDAVGAVELGAGTEGAEPTVTASAPATALVPEKAETPDEAGVSDEAEGDDEPADASESDESGELAESVEGSASDAGDAASGLEEPDPLEVDVVDVLEEVDVFEEVDEYDTDYEDYADGEVPEGGEALEYDEADEDYESGEIAEPRRARRWPRVLLAFGFVVLAVVIVGGAIAIVGSVTHGFKKPVKITYKKSAVFSLQTGDCFDPQGQSYSLVSCDSSHVAEVFATFALTGTEWPGNAAVESAASSGCASRLTGYVNPQLAISLASTYVYPNSVAWQAGTRTVICEVRASSGTLTGSVRGASASAS
jgi:Septum formation